MAILKFTSSIKIHGVNPYVLVSAERAAKLKEGWRKPMPVLVQVNGKPEPPWRINMMPVGNGSFRLYLHATVRTASQTKVGDRANFAVSFDAAYKTGPSHPMPQWFSVALSADATAKNNWKKLSPSRRKEILRYFSGLKSPEARVRNLVRALHVLSGETGRFMARSWSGGK